MLIQLLFTETASFIVYVFSAFVFFAAGLLHFDSWRADTGKHMLLVRSIGFLFLAAVSVISAPSLRISWITLASQLIRIAGLILILVSLIREPLLHPQNTDVRAKKSGPTKDVVVFFVPLVLPLLASSLAPVAAVFTLLIAATCLRKATEGFEKQIQPVFWAFLFLGGAAIFRIFFAWSDTTIVYWSKILMPYGVLWYLERSFEFTGICILAVWVWGYIRFRLQLQLFVSMVALTLMIFLTTTVFYTFLLLRNLETDALAHLKTDVQVLQYSLDSLRERTRSYAQTVSQDSNIREALISGDKSELHRLLTVYMTEQKVTTLLIASSSGEVIMRAEDKDRTNDSVGNELLITHALRGESISTVSYDRGIIIPEISVLATAPIRAGARPERVIEGIVITGITIDSAFVDGVKTVTGLDIAVFGGNTRAATTFIAPDGKSRHVGTLETNKQILDVVLRQGKVFVGSTNVLNLPFYTAYAPLISYDKKVVGMLFVGKVQSTLIEAAKKSIELTYGGSIILLLIALIPAYVFSRYLKEHQDA